MIMKALYIFQLNTKEGVHCVSKSLIPSGKQRNIKVEKKHYLNFLCKVNVSLATITLIYNIKVSVEVAGCKKMYFQFLLFQLFEEFTYKNMICHLYMISVQLFKMKQLKGAN